jgi:hypothetical protein
VPRLLSALLIALALSACEESADDEYRDEFPGINRELSALGDEVSQGLRDAGGSDDRALAADFGGYARRLGELRERLEELEAPDRLAGHPDALLAAMGSVRRALADVEGAAERSDPATAREAAIRLVRDGERLDEARAELARAVRGL